jgi:hypothetical protein
VFENGVGGLYKEGSGHKESLDFKVSLLQESSLDLKCMSMSENVRFYLFTGSTAIFAGYFKVLKRTWE